MKVVEVLSPKDLLQLTRRVCELGSEKTLALARRWRPQDGAPVVTIRGQYTARSWTQWTQGFQFGNALLCFESTGEPELFRFGAESTLSVMPTHLTHIGVHDHGFNTISTFGQLRRLILEHAADRHATHLEACDLAIRVSGAVQASRWKDIGNGDGYIYSFNGPQSLFIDTIRSLRVLGLSHQLGHELFGEQDERFDLLERLLAHARTTSKFNIFFGEGRDVYDTEEFRGRTVHESIFNTVGGSYRCPSSQQGYSPFSTWTRGLAWAMLGFAEQLEFLNSLLATHPETLASAIEMMRKAAIATCDFYIDRASARDGICYWDTGAPRLHELGDWRDRDAEPMNDVEPVDASASVVAAQGLLRLGHVLGASGNRYTQAGLGIAKRLFGEPYLATGDGVEGLLLHSIYHRPNGWDYVPPGSNIPYGESSMWGDYHLLELALLVRRMAEDRYYTFFSIDPEVAR